MQPADPTLHSDRSRSTNPVSPDRLLAPFTRTPIGRSYVLSIVVHAGVILLLSVAYIRDTWIDPEGAKARAEALKAKQIQQATSNPDPTAPAETPSPTATPAASLSATGAPAASPKADSAKTDLEILEERKDTAVGRAITETANPTEVVPGGEGLPLGR